MNRQIKFRAWDKKNKKFWYNIILHLDSQQVETMGLEMLNCPEECELMQFTGLLDKNGKEIYEGDILQEKVGHRSIHRIIWDAEECRFEALFNGYSGQSLKRHIKDIVNFEVIGNIYENNELLKGSL